MRLNRKGLSLVEVVMSALLLSVVLAALFASYRNANNLISLSRSKLLALTWAQSLIENQRATLGGTPTQSALINEKGGRALTPEIYDLGQDMQSVKVTITWTE